MKKLYTFEDPRLDRQIQEIVQSASSLVGVPGPKGDKGDPGEPAGVDVFTITILRGLDNGAGMPGAALQAKIDALVAAGADPENIMWASKGTE